MKQTTFERAAEAPLYALSLDQPWAWLWVTGRKRFETRSWHRRFRGPLLVHATKSLKGYQREACRNGPIGRALDEAGLALEELPRGALLGVLRVTAWRPTPPPDALMTEREWAFGNFDWGRFAIDADRRSVFAEPLPWRGYHQIWKVRDAPPALRAAARACERGLTVVGRDGPADPMTDPPQGYKGLIAGA